ncbi:MAG TPA: hypothetical protein VIY29_05175 [Ktedonobacteraceae bacterium]
MTPNHGNEYLAFERVQKMEAEREQLHLLTRLRRSRSSRVPHLVGSLGTLIVAFGTKMQQFEQRGERTV